MDQQSALPAQFTPHDSLRLGLRTLKDEASVSHAVEAIQKNMGKQQEDLKLAMMRDIYGSGLAARHSIEKQILCRAADLPGRPTSNLGWEALSGELDDFSLESFLGQPADSVVPPPDLHSQMEAKLRMNTQQMTRGLP